MTIVQSASGTFNGTSFTVTLPAASTSGNRVVVVIAGNTTVSTPAGFSLRTSKINFMGHYLFDVAGAASSWNFTNAAGQGTWVALEILNGVYDTSASAENSANSATYNTPSLIPAAGLKLVIASIASDSPGGGRTISGWTNSFTEIADVLYAGADYPMQGVATLEVTAAGASYSTTATYSSASDGRSAIIGSYVTTSSGGGGTNYTASPADAEGITDTATNVMAAVRSAADPVGIADAASGVLAGVRAPADAVGISDSAALAAALVRSAADSLGITDSAVDVLDAVRVPADQVGIADSVSAQLDVAGDKTSTPADVVGVTDAVSVLMSRIVTVADFVAVADAATPALGRIAGAADPVGIADAAVFTSATVRGPADPVGIVDAVTVSLSRVVVIADAVGIADSALGRTNVIDRDLTLRAEPLAERFAVNEDQLELVATPLGGRWSTTPEES